MSRAVLDASAVLAMLQGEAGAEAVFIISGATGEGVAARRGTEVAVDRFGRSSVSAQISALLRDGIVRACTENGGAVAYAAVAGIGGQARIAVGNPLVARADEEGAAAEFLARARADERRAAFFGVEGHDGEAPTKPMLVALILRSRIRGKGPHGV